MSFIKKIDLIVQSLLYNHMWIWTSMQINRRQLRNDNGNIGTVLYNNGILPLKAT